METFHSNFRDPISEGDQKAEAEDTSDIVSFVREHLGFDPDEKQQLVLRGGRRGIVNCTRQWGKSTVTAAKAVHRAYSVAGSLTLVVTPSARQSGEFLRKAEEFVRKLGIKVRGATSGSELACRAREFRLSCWPRRAPKETIGTP